MAKFKTRARTVDMLGRQQIAGIPNAINELFKNAHDAYADHVEVDYFRSDNLFVLRDDGLGMTKDDFENRWLTLGTESKLAGTKGINAPPADPTKRPRPITGEKGIGRLAIAVIGPQVLVLSRAKRGNTLHDLVAAYIHWGLFEAPGVNLEQIEIPVREFPGGTIPSPNDLQGMIEVVRNNVKHLQTDEQIELKHAEKIQQELDLFGFDLAQNVEFLGSPSLLGDGHGTQFFILPTNENLSDDLDVSLQDIKEIPRTKRLLLGFTNTMSPDSETLPIEVAFRDWKSDDQYTDIINALEFFTPEEFYMVDHHFQGEFDEFGQFNGQVAVYGEDPVEYPVPWPKARGRPVACGPFSLKIAYLPGLKRESKVIPEEYARLNEKLGRIGGLYIYQDGIRVLPYGDINFDFLEIEKRRNLKASTYFFSYRRMFGTIEISREQNTRLVEKAGREGFQENKAYRDFRAILINFLIQIAADFFRDDGEYASTWVETKEELNHLDKAKKKQDKKSREKKRQLKANLDSFFDKIEDGDIDDEIEQILASFREQISTIAQNGDGIELIGAEVVASRDLAQLKQSLRVERPRGVGLNQQIKRDLRTYSAEFERVEQEVFLPAESAIRNLVIQASKQLDFAVNERQRIDLMLNEAVVSSRTKVEEQLIKVRTSLEQLRKKIDGLAEEITVTMRHTADSIEAEFNRLEISENNQRTIEALNRKWEERIEVEADNFYEELTYTTAQLDNINWSRDPDGYLIGDAEVMAALEDEVLALRERAEADLELSQLGMAIEIINHEFNNTILSIRKNLTRLKPWADANKELNLLYRDIRTSFEHLDAYLTLFTPLNRRLYRQPISIDGFDIVTYLGDLFRQALDEHEIELVATNAFKETTVVGYPSTFYPVFVNLIDNSIYWLKERAQPRQISLDANDIGFVVSDTGPGVSNRDQEAIFELGFSRKPGGRGMGLHIAREVLNKVGYSLELDSASQDSGTTFVIRFPVEE